MQKEYSCINLYKNGKTTPERSSYIQIWTALINSIERSELLLSGTDTKKYGDH